ncbi:MAG: hypothetical protein HQL34_04160, partial [Alphaproteobacteria bacterium]|nr:hypothetical protein [Alphaproteobacteria bacterium]
MADKTETPNNLTAEQELDTQVFNDLTALQDDGPKVEDRAFEQSQVNVSSTDNSDLGNIHMGGSAHTVTQRADDATNGVLRTNVDIAVDAYSGGATLPPVFVGSEGDQRTQSATGVESDQFGVHIPGRGRGRETDRERDAAEGPEQTLAPTREDETVAPTATEPATTEPTATTAVTTEPATTEPV